MLVTIQKNKGLEWTLQLTEIWLMGKITEKPNIVVYKYCKLFRKIKYN